jgi:hypothetical protein
VEFVNSEMRMQAVVPMALVTICGLATFVIL